MKKIISESLDLPINSRSKDTKSDNFLNKQFGATKVNECGGEHLALNVPNQIKLKIKQNEYINLAILLKGAVDFETTQGAFLGVDENGQIVTKPRSPTEKYIPLKNGQMPS